MRIHAKRHRVALHLVVQRLDRLAVEVIPVVVREDQEVDRRRGLRGKGIAAPELKAFIHE